VDAKGGIDGHVRVCGQHWVAAVEGEAEARRETPE
jgi:hypothetical protein